MLQIEGGNVYKPASPLYPLERKYGICSNDIKIPNVAFLRSQQDNEAIAMQIGSLLLICVSPWEILK